VAEAVAKRPALAYTSDAAPGTTAINSRRGRFAGFARIGHILAVVSAAILLIAAGSLYVFRTMYGDKVLPSVYVADVQVGGMTQTEAQAAVDARANALLSETFAFDFQGRTWTTTLGDLGVTANTSASVASAFDIGRENGAKDRLSSAYTVASGDKVVPLNLTVNPAAVDAWADQVTADIGQQPHNAELLVTDGNLSVTNEVDGVVVDKDELKNIVGSSIATLAPFRGTLPTVNKVAQIRATDIQPQVAQLQTALATPIKLTYKSKHWTLTAKDLGQFVQITESKTGPGYDVKIDDTALGQFIYGMVGDRVNRAPVDAKIQWNADKGHVEAYSDSSKGVKIQAADTADAVAKSLMSDHASVEITVKGIAPTIDSDHLDALHIDEQLAVGTSSFYGSKEERAINIAVGTQLLNGALVKPRADFSFNAAIGDITPEAGYVEAPIIAGERIGKDVGGGICQVSTTMFRAALLAGMPILDWWPHEYRLNFYEFDGWTPGLDASILQARPREDWGDLKFTNATDG